MRRLILFSPALLLALVACGGGASSGGTPTSPSGPARASHNAGRDCLECHGFTMAGTVYRDDGSAYPGAVVRITTGPGGTGDVVVSLTTDASGSFYTDRAVSWDSGLHADVSGASLRAMEEAVISGACNSCHAGADRIRAE